MALGKSIWRPVHVNAWDWLESASPLAQRLWLWLWTGPASTSCGLVSMREYQAVGALRTKPVALRAALDELASLGRVVVQDRTRDRVDLYLAGFVTAQCRVKDVQRNGIRDDIERFADGLAKAQAVEDWEVWNLACDEADDSQKRGKRQPEPQKKLNKTNQNKTSETPIGVPAVAAAPVASGVDIPEWAASAAAKAAAPVTGWGFDPNFGKSQPEPEPPAEEPQDFPEPDWSSIQRSYSDDPDDEPIPVPTLTPAARAKLEAAEAARQNELKLEPPKPAKKPQTPAQLDAIFAQERLREAVDLWNEVLGKTTCGPADAKSLRKMATQLMTNLAHYRHVECKNPAVLIDWANARSDFHSGKGRRTWTFQQWFSTDHLAQVYADYRNDRADLRTITYFPNRTLRDWRTECEDLAACIAEGRVWNAEVAA